MNKFEFHFYTSFMRYFKDKLTNNFCDTPFLIGFKKDLEILLKKINEELEKKN